MIEEANITIIAAESFKNDPSSSVKYLLKVKLHTFYLEWIESINLVKPHDLSVNRSNFRN